ncbi:ROK family protein [Flavobacteriaceae bacterium F89]|uniref:ROK family protein n=1 Tax=Cerina litoralis TaxID=2874477 RepID=A0AAE3EY12_9FLAO|nr:ROK family protein [Cerina litoralis]MCG2462363.1 ROK family protein [Cerina litoralis]
MAYFVGIDLGGTRIKIALGDDKRILITRNVKARKELSFMSNIRIIEDTIKVICEEQKIMFMDISSIGFSFPSLVNNELKKVISTNDKFNDAKEFDWVEWSKSTFGAYISLENDARMACYGEWKSGAGRPFTDFVMMTLGTGVGTAVIMDGNPLVGKHFQAGNLGGHLTVDYAGALCSCGNRGCVEAEASSTALKRLVETHPKILESELKNRSKIDFATIFDLAESDLVALEIRDHCLDVWSAAIVNYIHAYDPEAIIISGGIMNSKKIILPYLREKVGGLAWSPWGHVAILSSELNDNAGVNGAFLMAKNEFEKHERKKIKLR